MITAQEVRDMLNRPIPKSISQIENQANWRIKWESATVLNVQLLDADGVALFDQTYTIADLLTSKGKLRADVRKLVQPLLSRTDRISVTTV